MEISYLYSGSSGNCTYVKTLQTNIVIDAGVSYKKTVEVLSKKLIADIILVTHEHGDHVSSLGVLARKTGAVIIIPEKSYEKIKGKLKNCKILFIKGGETLEYKDTLITTFSTKHDSLESVGYRITEKSTNKNYTHITDTGVLTYLILEYAKTANGLFIEADYDTYLLDKYKEYDDYLKVRINSSIGHLSNQQVIKFLNNGSHIFDWLVLGHLSEKTNSPDVIKTLIDKNLNDADAKKITIFESTLIKKEIL